MTSAQVAASFAAGGVLVRVAEEHIAAVPIDRNRDFRTLKGDVQHEPCQDLRQRLRFTAR
jgi:hypothetical protein